jgi:hypothetical protein
MGRSKHGLVVSSGCRSLQRFTFFCNRTASWKYGDRSKKAKKEKQKRKQKRSKKGDAALCYCFILGARSAVR